MKLQDLIDIDRVNSTVGDVVEVGVFGGASAKDICELLCFDNKRFYLIDTFKGLPEPSSKNDEWAKDFVGRFKGNIDQVKSLADKYSFIKLLVGRVEDVASKYLFDNVFSFVHIDCDLYECTRFSLDFFFNRLVVGGVILVHDYHWSGVKLAVDECINENISLLLKHGPIRVY